NQDPDPGGVLSTSNDVSGKLVTAGAAPGAMGLGSDDPRAVVSAEGFFVNNPFDIINSPVDPNGVSGDIAINLAFNIGTLAFGQSTSATYALLFGANTSAVSTLYSQQSSKTTNTSDEDYYSITLTAGQSISLRTTTPADGPGEFLNTLDPVLTLLNPSNVQVASDDNSSGDGHNAKIIYTAPASGTYKV